MGEWVGPPQLWRSLITTYSPGPGLRNTDLDHQNFAFTLKTRDADDECTTTNLNNLNTLPHPPFPSPPCYYSTAKFRDPAPEHRGAGGRECDFGVQCHRPTAAQSLLDEGRPDPPAQRRSH